MSDNNSSKSIFNLIPDSFDNATKNLTDLPTKTIKQTLSDCWYLVFGKLSHMAEKRRIKYATELEKFKKELTSSIETIPDEFRVDADSQVALLALNNAKFCVEKEDLRAMYVKLLSSAVDSRKTVHPAFSQIILSMDYIDAVILSQFKEKKHIPICNYNIYDSEIHPSKYQMLATNIIMQKPDNISLLEASRSIDSLKRLGLIDTPIGVRIQDDITYDIFKQTELYNDLVSNYSEQLVYIQKGIAILTNLGASFIDCCL